MRERRRVGGEEGSGGANDGAAAAPAGESTHVAALAGGFADTLQRWRLRGTLISDGHAGGDRQLQNTAALLTFSSIPVLRDSSIRKKIIGPTLLPRSFRLGERLGSRHARGAIAFLEQQARHGGVRLIRQPLIHERHNLLSQVRRIREPRELETLQRVFGCRQQKVPGRLKRAGSHGGLRMCDGDIPPCDSNTVISGQEYASNTACGKLWKTFRGSTGRAA
jgi:hypothetical protein